MTFTTWPSLMTWTISSRQLSSYQHTTVSIIDMGMLLKTKCKCKHLFLKTPLTHWRRTEFVASRDVNQAFCAINSTGVLIDSSKTEQFNIPTAKLLFSWEHYWSISTIHFDFIFSTGTKIFQICFSLSSFSWTWIHSFSAIILLRSSSYLGSGPN